MTKRRSSKSSEPPATGRADDKLVRLTPAEAERAAALLTELHEGLGDELRAMRLELTADLMRLGAAARVSIERS